MILSTDQTVVTIAGNGIFGYSGDGGLATSASLFTPYGVAVDPVGRDVYIADTGNNVIRMVRDGIITTIAGIGGRPGGYSGDNGLSVNATLNLPRGLAVSRTADSLLIYVADTNNHRIRKVSAYNNSLHLATIVTIAGTGVPGCSNDTGMIHHCIRMTSLTSLHCSHHPALANESMVSIRNHTQFCI